MRRAKRGGFSFGRPKKNDRLEHLKNSAEKTDTTEYKLTTDNKKDLHMKYFGNVNEEEFAKEEEFEEIAESEAVQEVEGNEAPNAEEQENLDDDIKIFKVGEKAEAVETVQEEPEIKNPTEDTAEEAIEEVTETTTEEAAEDVAEVITEEATEEATEAIETSEEASEETIEEATEDAKKEEELPTTDINKEDVEDTGKKKKKEKKPKKPKSRKQKVLIVLLSLLIILILSAGAVILGGILAGNSILVKDDDDSEYFEEVDEVTGKVNVLLLGVDNEGLRTDTIILASVDTDDATVNLLSIPRDTRMYVGSKYQKINAAHAITNGTGKIMGPKGTVEAVTRLTGIPINYYVEFSFSSFRDTVDALGGIDFDVPRNMDYEDPYQDLYIHLKQGYQHLDGDKAEQFVRFRRYPEGDIKRVEMQQKFIEALFQQKLNTTIITKVPELYKSLTKNVKTNMSLKNATKYGAALLKIPSENIKMYQLPGDYSGSQYDASYWLANMTELATLVHDVFGYETDTMTLGKAGTQILSYDGTKNTAKSSSSSEKKKKSSTTEKTESKSKQKETTKETSKETKSTKTETVKETSKEKTTNSSAAKTQTNSTTQETVKQEKKTTAPEVVKEEPKQVEEPVNKETESSETKGFVRPSAN